MTLVIAAVTITEALILAAVYIRSGFLSFPGLIEANVLLRVVKSKFLHDLL